MEKEEGKEESRRRRMHPTALGNLPCLPQTSLNTRVKTAIPDDGHLTPSHFPGPLTVPHSELTFLSPFWLQDQQTYDIFGKQSP